MYERSGLQIEWLATRQLGVNGMSDVAFTMLNCTMGRGFSRWIIILCVLTALSILFSMFLLALSVRHGTAAVELDVPVTMAQRYDMTVRVVPRNNSTVPRGRETKLPASLRKPFPRYMIVGFGKSGTRALYNALRMHPQLNGPGSEERFFSLMYGEGLATYLNSFPAPPAGGYLIEKSPDYIIMPAVPSRIVQAVKRVHVDTRYLKFIVMLRDPIDRAMSEYLEWDVQRRYHHKKPLLPFEKMVLRNGTLDVQQPFINASCYAYHIRNWLRTFPNDQMCYVDGDKFVTDPLTQIQSLENCMGLERYFSPQNFVFSEKRGFYCFKKSRLQCMGGSKGRKHPEIPPDVRTKLSLYFEQCNAGLDDLISARTRQISD